MKNIKGFTYIEIAITMLMLAISMIPVLKIYLKNYQSNEFVNQLWFVHQVVENFIQQIQSNNYHGLSQQYFTQIAHPPSCMVCNKDEQAAKHRFYLDNTIKSKLYNAKIKLRSNGNLCHINIIWHNRFKDEHQYSMEFYC